MAPVACWPIIHPSDTCAPTESPVLARGGPPGIGRPNAVPGRHPICHPHSEMEKVHRTASARQGHPTKKNEFPEAEVGEKTDMEERCEIGCELWKKPPTGKTKEKKGTRLAVRGGPGFRQTHHGGCWQ